ncbi:hypothetical protein EJ06DRAFT_553771 [Trichodelitschia bisporula]|uniref:V-type proton ATPase subunit e n=1 Tax=Trichodelitschia bisporula TaxID=703511 RepID=A0A6G1I5C4_9PEZI|nr:hypothetical protein EJ06DRAFT_553771 [Trichodelitschia bisporula]
MANGWSLIIGFVIVALFSGISWVAAPKGDTQTVWRSSLLLSAWACFIMWAITFLAQWHPLIVPINGKLRPGYD